MPSKILVLDDDLGTSQLAEAVLESQFGGGDVLVAQSAADSFERFGLAQPDLILLSEALPDTDTESLCYRLLMDASTAEVPVILIGGDPNAAHMPQRFPNVKKVLAHPLTSENLGEAMASFLPKTGAVQNPARLRLKYDPSQIAFSGHTGFFSLRAALGMAHSDRLSGVLRFFLNKVPIEVYLNKGRLVFATTRNFQLYCRESPAILSGSNLGSIVEAQLHQSLTGCPLFLFISSRGGFPHDDVVQIIRDHGQRLFAHLWSAGRVYFEFEQLEDFPDYVKNFPASPEDPDNWVLSSLRFVRFEALRAQQRPDPNGSPAYTRKGYELIQKLKLNDVEARFATAVNGAESLQTIARKIGIPLNDALLIVFRFSALEIIDYWSPSVLSLQNGTPEETPGEG